MNFISQVINIINENDISDARVGLRKLRNDIGQYQGEAREYIDDNYADFKDFIAANNGLLEQGDKLSMELDSLYQKIDVDSKDGILAAANDVQNYLAEMEELRIGFRVNHRLVRIDNLFRELELTRGSEQINNVHTVLQQLKECIFEHEDHDILKQLDCYQNIKNRYQTERESFSSLLMEMFEKGFKLEERSFQTSKCMVIKISHDVRLQQVFYLLLKTTFNLNRLYTFFMSNVFEPILTRPVCFEVKAAKDAQDHTEYTVIEVSFSTKQMGSGERNLRSHYKVVFNHLINTFNALKPINIVLPNKKRFIQGMADKVANEFYDLLISECLEYAIPERIDDLCSSELAKDVKTFDDFLKTTEFISDTTTNKLNEFIEKIDVIFKKRFCLDILNRAVQIMRKDLHEMQVVEETGGNGNFPRCMVSRSTFELINLMQQVLTESENITAKSVDAYVLADIKERLRETIPTILQRYPTEILDAHGKLLQTIPQQAALFHNNCMYLAWWFSRCDVDGTDGTSTFLCDTTNSHLQEFGLKQFGTQISNQRTQLLGILKDFGRFLF